ncbi:unnamed protein product, partial [Brassica rapa]
LLGAITRSLRSNFPPKKKIQLRPWFLHRRCSWALLQSMHVTCGSLLELIRFDPPPELLIDPPPELVFF